MLQENSPITIAYYPFRSKGQVARLLCEYLRVPYSDYFFDPETWANFRLQLAQRHVLVDLPFLQDGNFFVSGENGVINYIVEKSGRPDMLGKTLKDQAKIEHWRCRGDPKNILVCSKVQWRDIPREKEEKMVIELWNKRLVPMLAEFEGHCKDNDWFFGYPTIFDFTIYEAMEVMRLCLGEQRVSQFPKLLKVQKKVRNLPEIASYEQAEYAVQSRCPLFYFKEFK